MAERGEMRVRILRKNADGGRGDVADLDPAQRLEMMWQLALDA